MKLIKTSADHTAALKRLEALMLADPAPGSTEHEDLELLAFLIEDFEKRTVEIPAATPVDVIRFRMEQGGLKQKDLVPFIGSKSRVWLHRPGGAIEWLLAGVCPLTCRTRQILRIKPVPAPIHPEPIVHYLDETAAISCPYGEARRVVTGGAGGVANVHVIRVTQGSRHVHKGYSEVYYVLSGRGMIRLNEETHALRPGAVVVIPAGVPHSLESKGGEPLEFIIFGTPPMPIDDPRARPAAQ